MLHHSPALGGKFLFLYVQSGPPQLFLYSFSICLFPTMGKNFTFSESTFQSLPGHSCSVLSLFTTEPWALSLHIWVMFLRPANPSLGDLWALSKVLSDENILLIV